MFILGEFTYMWSAIKSSIIGWRISVCFTPLSSVLGKWGTRNMDVSAAAQLPCASHTDLKDL